MIKRIRFCIFLAIYAGMVLFYANYVESARKVEQSKPPLVGSITIYTDIPSSVSLFLADKYQDTYHVKMTVLPLTEEQLAEKLAKDDGLPNGDIVITSKENLQIGNKNNRFKSLINPSVDLISSRFRDKDYFWVGTWYDPIVFVEKIDNGDPITTWEGLLNTGVKQVAIPDFAATRTASNILYSFVEVYGKDNAGAYFKALKPHIAQYTKYVATSERLVALGEVPIGIGTYSDSKIYAKKEYGVKTIYPQDDTPYMMTGVAILANSANDYTSKNFIKWLLSEDVAKQLNSQKVYYMYTNPEIKNEKDDLGHEINLMNTQSVYNEEGKQSLIDEWIKAIRF